MSATAMIEPAIVPLPGFEPPDLTLEQLISSAWVALSRHQTIECPVCGADMQPDYGAHALPLGGRCHGCGSELR